MSSFDLDNITKYEFREGHMIRGSFRYHVSDDGLFVKLADVESLLLEKDSLEERVEALEQYTKRLHDRIVDIESTSSVIGGLHYGGPQEGVT